MIAQDKTLPALPAGLLRLEGEALRKAKDLFWDALPKELADSGKKLDVQDVFYATMTEVLLKCGLPVKGLCLDAINEGRLAFAGEGQKAAFISWVCASTSLPNVESMVAVHAQATAQAALFREIAQANPPMAAQEILSRMNAIAAQTRTIIDAANEAAEKSRNEMQRVNADDIAKNAAYVTRLMLQSGEPPLDAAGLQKVFDALNRKDVQEKAGQLKQVAGNPEIAKAGDAARLADAASGITLATEPLAAFLNRPYDEPGRLQNISMLPAAVRDAVKALAPEAGAKMDALFPAYAPFPKPANPQSMPATEQQRRAFLVKTLDTYMDKEKAGGEAPDFTHGRGHITRAYIFANAMCTILEEEEGVPVDRNAVLCGITGHDIGREGGGEDKWEGKSATMTTQAMQNEFGKDSMGGDYEKGIANNIQHKKDNVEGMLLDSADSLDIGRTGDLIEDYFPFLADKNPNKGEREPDKYMVSSPRAKQLRRQLQQEARLLQQLTDPKTANFEKNIDLMSHMYSGKPQENEIVKTQWQELQKETKKQYIDSWLIASETYVKNMEDIVLGNPVKFPLLSRYYRKG